ncbi:hypothetical protein THTE_0293 [Thermogutta terrifontis]|uniref:Uncharacterized protein n=1 Tax=Thermogutta terrifontis TaxID=1331910 RepID=A0A286RA92_9BACT|nr:hypothetical protein THTE_0293 [Thermogutta terrifontis]
MGQTLWVFARSVYHEARGHLALKYCILLPFFSILHDGQTADSSQARDTQSGFGRESCRAA